MNAEEYLNQLKGQLKDFSPDETAALMDEIRAHIEEGLEDPHLGQGKQRSQKLQAEMGSPVDMGRGFKEIYHPNRWINFLLGFVPFEVLRAPLGILLTLILGSTHDYSPWFTAPYAMTSVRVTIVLYALLVLIALRRKSMDLLFFWLPQTILNVYVLIYREKRWMVNGYFNHQTAGALESLFWLVSLCGLVGWLGYWIWRQRRDSQLVVLALLPFLVTLGNMALNPYLARGLFPGNYQLPRWQVTLPGGFPFGVYQVSVILWPALFYLFRQRQVRWLGLMFNAIPLALMNLVASLRYPHLSAIWAIPIVLVLGAWLLDFRRQPFRPRLIA